MFGLFFYLYAMLANDNDNPTERETALNPSRSWTFYVEQHSGWMVSVYSDSQSNMTAGCYVSAEKIVLNYVKGIFPNSNIISVDNLTIERLIDSCTRAKLRRQTLDDDGEEVWQMFGRLSALFILPGTKWCGAGNIANNKNDLGRASEADKCCREHDYCDDYIIGGGMKHGLRNDSPFTKSHCKCDSQFHSCLKKAGTWTSNAVGVIYFDFLQLECFKKDHPVTRCKKYVKKRCMEYEQDRSRKKKWQVFDAKCYKWVFSKNTVLREKGDVFDYMIRRVYEDNPYERMQTQTPNKLFGLFSFN
ncbi:Phospholipase A2 [Araneus ventricosus]|uniref:Phospholipase A2 n=1 Tax=Araneus ventricosus TaxID=182803 RepID=A0A4Y2QHV1_ARAVE|nr:Phospholipase A2 [Araneus ventricosus]